MIEVIKPGLYSSIQDLGRFGYRKFGVPTSGVMDAVSANFANRLLQNSDKDAVLEFTMQGPELFITTATTITISGGGFPIYLNESEVHLNTPITVPENSTLKFGSPSFGVRGYLAVKGGFKTAEILKSRSYYANVTKSAILKKGEMLLIDSQTEQIERMSSVHVDDVHFTNTKIEVYKGPDFEFLPKEIQKKLIAETFVVGSKSNRMAYMLDSNSEISAEGIISAPAQPGTVQLTPSGQLAVLMRDSQTTGGYARVLQLTEQAICQLAQKRAGEQLNFVLKK